MKAYKEGIYKENIEVFEKEFLKSMNEDFNSPRALSIVFRMARKINKIFSENDFTKNNDKRDIVVVLSEKLKEFCSVFNILQKDPDDFFCEHVLNKSGGEINEGLIASFILKRNAARKEKDWKLADEIRGKLNKLSIILEDTEEKTIWRFK